jgi:2,4-dienoyl-CoA reductase-like NADH-dependent reductase (Old Yellow Enzyme family)
MSTASPSKLFSPIKMRGLELHNRLVIAPMCQYSADNGTMTDWHMYHVPNLGNSGAALAIIEATAVEPEGRISHGCTTLCSDANEAAMKRVVESAKKNGTAKIGIQLAHAGRKASCARPWEGGQSLKTSDAWQTKSASAIPFQPGWHTPKPMTLDDIAKLKESFRQATIRADRAGFDLIEIHAAHGYLMNQFLSPISNKRDDQYGGSLENRMRLPLEIFSVVREAWPANKPLGIRISAVEWVEDGIKIEDSIELAKRLDALGCDFIDVSSGGNAHNQKIDLKPGYQVAFAAAIKKAVKMPVMAVGLITEPEQAESIVVRGEADMIAIARAVMDEPHWGRHAAWALGAEVPLVPQHLRVNPKTWPPARKWVPAARKAAE